MHPLAAWQHYALCTAWREVHAAVGKYCCITHTLVSVKWVGVSAEGKQPTAQAGVKAGVKAGVRAGVKAGVNAGVKAIETAPLRLI